MFPRSSSLYGDANRMQRKKTASERRAQRLRAEGRRIQHTLSALNEVLSHRGGQLTKFGQCLRVAITQMDGLSPQSADDDYDAVPPKGPEFQDNITDECQKAVPGVRYLDCSQDLPASSVTSFPASHCDRTDGIGADAIEISTVPEVHPVGDNHSPLPQGTITSGFWEVTDIFSRVRVRSEMSISSQELTSYRTGSSVCGVRHGDWLQLQHEPGFMLITADGKDLLRFSHLAPVEDVCNTASHLRINIDAVLNRSTAVSAGLDLAFRHLFSCLHYEPSGGEHFGCSAFLPPAASPEQLNQVENRTNAEMHLVQLFSDFCRIRAHDPPIPLSSSSLPQGSGEVVWHNPWVSTASIYTSDLENMKLKQYDCSISGLKFRSWSRKQQERLGFFQDLLSRFAEQSRDAPDNKEIGEASISCDQGLAVSRSSGSDEDVDGSSDYDDFRGLVQHLQSLGDGNGHNLPPLSELL